MLQYGSVSLATAKWAVRSQTFAVDPELLSSCCHNRYSSHALLWTSRARLHCISLHRTCSLWLRKHKSGVQNEKPEWQEPHFDRPCSVSLCERAAALTAEYSLYRIFDDSPLSWLMSAFAALGPMAMPSCWK